jgi:MYXO-CTERM domain-containing protein
MPGQAGIDPSCDPGPGGAHPGMTPAALMALLRHVRRRESGQGQALSA